MPPEAREFAKFNMEFDVLHSDNDEECYLSAYSRWAAEFAQVVARGVLPASENLIYDEEIVDDFRDYNNRMLAPSCIDGFLQGLEMLGRELGAKGEFRDPVRSQRLVTHISC